MPEVRVISPFLQVSPNKLRVAAYCRVSSDSADQLNSFISQVNHYTGYIQSNPECELADIYADEGLTGTRMDKREDFNRMLSDCRKSKIDRILVKSVSRFARNAQDCLMVTRELKALGISVFFEKEGIDTETVSSELFLTVMSSCAQEESVSISNNMRWSYRKRMQSGEFNCCRAAYGYTLTPDGLKINEGEAEVIRFVFESYLSGCGKQAITDMLNNISAPKRYGIEKWYINTIDYILNNERYIGDALLQKKYTTETLPFRKIKNVGQKDQYYVENSHPPIISRVIFETTQALQRKRRREYIQPSQNILLKKIKCGVCGSAARKKICNEKTYWVCKNHNRGVENCPVGQIPEQEIYDAFVHMVNILKLNENQILSPLLDQIKSVQTQSVNGCKVYEIDKKIAELNEQNLVLARLKAKGYMDSADFLTQSTSINQKVNKLRAERRRLIQKDENDQTFDDIKTLCDLIHDMDGCLTVFNEELFCEITKSITMISKTKLRFNLIGGLSLNVNLPGKERRCSIA